MAGRYPPLVGDIARWAERLSRQLERDYELWGGLRWETVAISAKCLYSAGSGSSQPDRDANTNDLLFAPNEEISANIVLPAGYKIGSAIVPFIFYEPVDANAGGYEWILYIGERDDGDTFNYSTSFVATTLSGTLSAGANRLHKLTFPSLSASVTTVNSMVELRLARTAATLTYGSDLRLKAIGLLCQTDRRGSRTETVKD